MLNSHWTDRSPLIFEMLQSGKYFLIFFNQHRNKIMICKRTFKKSQFCTGPDPLLFQVCSPLKNIIIATDQSQKREQWTALIRGKYHREDLKQSHTSLWKMQCSNFLPTAVWLFCWNPLLTEPLEPLEPLERFAWGKLLAVLVNYLVENIWLTRIKDQSTIQ